MPDHDKNAESNNIKCEDANNLYGCSMNEFLPNGEQEFVHEFDLDRILETFDNNNTSYIIKVDVHFHFELHDKFKEYPSTPETLTP